MKTGEPPYGEEVRTYQFASMRAPQRLTARQGQYAYFRILRSCMHQDVQVDGLERGVALYGFRQRQQAVCHGALGVESAYIRCDSNLSDNGWNYLLEPIISPEC